MSSFPLIHYQPYKHLNANTFAQHPKAPSSSNTLIPYFKDVTYGIKSGWHKWRALIRILCDRIVPLKQNGKFY